MARNAPIYVALSGLLVIIFAIICSTYIFPTIQKTTLIEKSALKPGNEAFEFWRNSPFPFKLKLYFFNVTNPELIELGEKPEIAEIGPYVYNEFRVNEILSVDDENDTISYNQRRIYFFNEKESGCKSPDDVLTLLNVGLVGMVNEVKASSPFTLRIMNDALPFLYPEGYKNIFITTTVKNFLFDGMKISCEAQDVELICNRLKSNKPPTIRLEGNASNYLLSMFNHLNNTKDGPYVISRGLKNPQFRGKIINYKNDNLLKQWAGSCKEIQSTDLTLNPVLMDKNQKSLDFFAADFCRTFPTNLQNNETVNYKGIDVLKYKGSFGHKNCFCGGNNLPICTSSGTMDISPCLGTPIIISQPHFLNSDQDFVKLQPNEDLHGIDILIEPTTGTTLVAKIRVQMNLFVYKIKEIDIFENITEGTFPFLWLEENWETPDIVVAKLSENLGKLKIFPTLKYVFMFLGVLLLAISFILAMIRDTFCSCGMVLKKNTVRNVQPQNNPIQNFSL